jgi:hypothetical protein
MAVKQKKFYNHAGRTTVSCLVSLKNFDVPLMGSVTGTFS